MLRCRFWGRFRSSVCRLGCLVRKCLLLDVRRDIHARRAFPAPGCPRVTLRWTVCGRGVGRNRCDHASRMPSRRAGQMRGRHGPLIRGRRMRAGISHLALFRLGTAAGTRCTHVAHAFLHIRIAGHARCENGLHAPFVGFIQGGPGAGESLDTIRAW